MVPKPSIADRNPVTGSVVPRLPGLDVLRGVAIVLMVFFHFVWDAASFDLIDPGLLGRSGWKLFGLSILVTFLSVSGFSLSWSWKHGASSRAFGMRFLKLSVCAALVTLSTWMMEPGYYIFFGVLHHLALGSVILFLLQRLNPAVSAFLAMASVVSPWLFRSEFFDQGWWLCLGWSETLPASQDYVPLFPWLSVMLAGSLVARLAPESLLTRTMGSRHRFWLDQFLGWAGRKSLWIYMLHQPILYGLVAFGAKFLAR